MRNRRYFIGVLGATALAGLSARSAFAQQTVDGWPQWPVRVISPTATGGPGQNFRFYADHLLSQAPTLLHPIRAGGAAILSFAEDQF